MELFVIPTAEQLTIEIKEELDKSREVKDALAEFSKIHQKRTSMEQTLQSNAARKQVLIKKKNELIESFGEGAEDTEKLESLLSEINVLNQANEILNHRLRDGGELARQEEDAGHTVNHQVDRALQPICKKYQQEVDRLFGDLLSLLKNYIDAAYTAWPRRTSDGVFIQQVPIYRLHHRLYVSNANLRLNGFTN